jgi:hypothetical protein
MGTAFSAGLNRDCFFSWVEWGRLFQMDLLVGMVWVGVGFRFENPHQAGLGFSGGEWVGVGFTVGF